jgi:hypothetical protein
MAALLLTAATQLAAADLGTLLTTPQERERLDRLRRGEPEAVSAHGAGGRGEVTGFVKRSDGRGTVWIDGVAVEVNSARGAPLLDAGTVRGRALPHDDRLKIERRPAR